MDENNNGVGESKFTYYKSLIEEYNSNKKLIEDLKKENYFLAIGHIYSSMDGQERSYDIIDQKYAIQLINTLSDKNIEIEKIINNSI